MSLFSAGSISLDSTFKEGDCKGPASSYRYANNLFDLRRNSNAYKKYIKNYDTDPKFLLLSTNMKIRQTFHPPDSMKVTSSVADPDPGSGAF
jgi:hypothetical protein